MKLAKSFVLFSSLLFTHILVSQNSLDYGNDANAWLICSSMQGSASFSSDESIAALDEILNTVGASRRFQLLSCENINNAVAITLQGVRYILYDPEWIALLDYSQDWAGRFILAHEVGHHINGHTIDAVVMMGDQKPVPLYKKRIQELEADKFAGFVMAKLGATLTQTLNAINQMSNEGDDSNSTHPSKSKRIAAATAGYIQAEGSTENSIAGRNAASPYSDIVFSNVENRILTSFFKDAVYDGTVSIATNEPFGYGTQKMNSGNIYEGEMAGGYRNGYGKFSFAGGGSYEGEWVNDEFVSGIYNSAYGNVDRGVFVNHGLHGYASRTFKSGNYMEGTFYNGTIQKVSYIKAGGDTSIIGFDDYVNSGFRAFNSITGNVIKSNFKDGKMVYSKHIIERRSKIKRRCYDVLKYIPESIQRDKNIPTVHYNPNNDDCSGLEKQLGYIEISVGGVPSYKGYGIQESYDIIRAGFGIYDYSGLYTIYSEEDLGGRWRYVGMYWDDKRNGEGILYFKDGTIEQGIWKDNVLLESKPIDILQMRADLQDFE